MATYTKPSTRERLKNKIKRGSKGGKPGQWSARKAQLLASEYEKSGGGYKGKKKQSQKHIQEWDDGSKKKKSKSKATKKKAASKKKADKKKTSKKTTAKKKVTRKKATKKKAARKTTSKKKATKKKTAKKKTARKTSR